MDKHIQQLFANSLVIDGLMSYYMLENPDCGDSDCSHYPIKDFGQLKALTGVDCGAVTVSDTIELPEEHAVVVTYKAATTMYRKTQPRGLLAGVQTSRRPGTKVVFLLFSIPKNIIPYTVP